MFLFTGLIVAGIFLNVRGVTGLGANLSGILKNEGLESQKNLNQTKDISPCEDSDNDGLCNYEEYIYRSDPFNPDTDGDGFLDGEEVASGHSPTKPGPDDFLSNINITDKVSTLIVGAYLAGDLNKEDDLDVYNRALADITVEMLNDGISILTPSNVSTNEILFSSDSKKAQENYLNNIGSIIQIDIWGELVNEPRVAATQFANFYTKDSKGIIEAKQFFNSKAEHYSKIIKEVSALAAPPSWLDVHQQILSNLQILAINHQALSQTIEDPLKGVIAMNNLLSVYNNIQPILFTITQRIEENELNPPNGQLWNLINSLTDGF
ncbi:MAG: Rhs family protein [Parcubacteria group bacterium Gr01-1014_2]|nr:MAG: Rhs family protein [Parcubacteria group bacterium Gr01-1014_2]